MQVKNDIIYVVIQLWYFEINDLGGNYEKEIFVICDCSFKFDLLCM